MALIEQRITDKIEITEDDAIQVRHATYIVNDETGERKYGPTYHRAAYVKGADVTAEDARVQAIAAALWL